MWKETYMYMKKGPERKKAAFMSHMKESRHTWISSRSKSIMTPMPYHIHVCVYVSLSLSCSLFPLLLNLSIFPLFLLPVSLSQYEFVPSQMNEWFMCVIMTHMNETWQTYEPTIGTFAILCNQAGSLLQCIAGRCSVLQCTYGPANGTFDINCTHAGSLHIRIAVPLLDVRHIPVCVYQHIYMDTYMYMHIYICIYIYIPTYI